MKQILILIFFLLFNFHSVVGQDSLIYTHNTQLTWDYFKGIPNHTDTAAARIATTIQMKIEKINIWTGVATFSTWSIMHPTKSWVDKKYMDDYTLNHEQLHFDISQLVAKRLEGYINQQRINGRDKKKATEVFNKHVIILNELQQKYDNETSGGNNQNEQAKWNDKIRNELKELEKQSQTTAKKYKTAY